MRVARSSSEAGVAVVFVGREAGKAVGSCGKLRRVRRSGMEEMVLREKLVQERTLRMSHQKWEVMARPVGRVRLRTRFTGCVGCVRYVRRLLVGPVTTGMDGGGVIDEWREETETCDGNMSMSKLSCTLIIGVSKRLII
jgi:hypothetical protein